MVRPCKDPFEVRHKTVQITVTTNDYFKLKSTAEESEHKHISPFLRSVLKENGLIESA